MMRRNEGQESSDHEKAASATRVLSSSSTTKATTIASPVSTSTSRRSTSSTSDPIVSSKKRERIRNAMIQFAKKEFTKSKHPPTNKNNTSIEKVASISPTPLKLLHTVMPQLHLNVNSRIIELGCGDARWLLYLCQSYNCQGIGVDIDPERLALAQQTISQWKDNKILIQERDIFDFLQSIPLNEKDVLIMYLFRNAMIRIASLLHEKGWKCAFEVSQHKSSTGKLKDSIESIQIVCIGFTLPGFKAIWSSQVEGIRCYIYHCMK